MKIGAVIVARLSSTRLPAKNMVPILGKPMIQHLIERVGRASGVDLVAIATSTEPSDTPLCELAEREGVPYHRGSLDNVMERVRTAAETLDCDAVAEILGDNPLVHSDLVDDVVRKFEEDSLDYAASVTNEYPGVDPSLKRFVLGVRVQVYRRELAARWPDFPDFLDRGLGTSAYIYYNPDQFKCGYVAASGPWSTLNRPELNFAVNYPKNLELTQHLFFALGSGGRDFTLPDVMRYMEGRPDLLDLMGEE